MDLLEKLKLLISEAAELYRSEVDAIAERILANGVTVQEWISVKDRFPKNGERVLACGAKGGVFMVRATTTPGFGKEDGASNYRSFDYWMPLPQPPKGN